MKFFCVFPYSEILVSFFIEFYLHTTGNYEPHEGGGAPRRCRSKVWLSVGPDTNAPFNVTEDILLANLWLTPCAKLKISNIMY